MGVLMANGLPEQKNENVLDSGVLVPAVEPEISVPAVEPDELVSLADFMAMDEDGQAAFTNVSPEQLSAWNQEAEQLTQEEKDAFTALIKDKIDPVTPAAENDGTAAFLAALNEQHGINLSALFITSYTRQRAILIPYVICRMFMLIPRIDAKASVNVWLMKLQKSAQKRNGHACIGSHKKAIQKPKPCTKILESNWISHFMCYQSAKSY